MVDGQGWSISQLIGGLVTGVVGSIGLYYHLRKLRNVNVVDSGVTQSLDVVLTSMREEIKRSETQRKKLEERVETLEDELSFFREQARFHGLPLR